ncbi:UNVERIFIED_CONTAM: hypothetical protein Sradi_4397600 [Sesamum radiatum]|uniref:Uncharacterized protein n=1 Tax=Sesamum radiatum TaxID=300843 RepID=A0AAW2NQX3_SESRA
MGMGLCAGGSRSQVGSSPEKWCKGGGQEDGLSLGSLVLGGQGGADRDGNEMSEAVAPKEEVPLKYHIPMQAAILGRWLRVDYTPGGRLFD